VPSLFAVRRLQGIRAGLRLYLLPLGPLLGIVAGFSGSVFLPCRDSVFKVPVAGGCPLLTLPS